jgi:hypothetical protein
MNQVALSSSVRVGDESVEVAARGSATSMGPNGWNPNLTWKGLWLIELCRDRL